MDPIERYALPALAGLLLVLAGPGQAGPGERARDRELAARVEARLEQVLARVSSTVVTVVVDTRQGETAVRSGGSGVILDPAGLILTNDHVTEGEDLVMIGLVGGARLPGRVIGRDLDGDLALIAVEARDLPAATPGDSRALRAGDPVVALGNPFGLADTDLHPAATLGIVSATNRYLGGSKVYGAALQIDAAVNPGNSGGPLFDLDGRLVGINGRISIRGESHHNVGVGYAIPIHEIERILPALRAGEQVRRGYLGVRFLVQGDGRPGVVVRDVLPGSPGAQAGLRAGDRIVAAAGEAIDHPVRLQNALAVLPAGTTVVLDIERGKERLRLRVTLGRRPGW